MIKRFIDKILIILMLLANIMIFLLALGNLDELSAIINSSFHSNYLLYLAHNPIVWLTVLINLFLLCYLVTSKSHV